ERSPVMVPAAVNRKRLIAYLQLILISAVAGYILGRWLAVGIVIFAATVVLIVTQLWKPMWLNDSESESTSFSLENPDSADIPSKWLTWRRCTWFVAATLLVGMLIGVLWPFWLLPPHLADTATIYIALSQL